jgi:hypothetical protein
MYDIAFTARLTLCSPGRDDKMRTAIAYVCPIVAQNGCNSDALNCSKAVNICAAVRRCVSHTALSKGVRPSDKLLNIGFIQLL